MTQVGVFVGNDPSSLMSYSDWAKVSPENVLSYLNNDNWAAFDSSIGWATNLWKPTGTPVIWSVPLTVWGTSLEEVATGAYDQHFLKAAQALAQTHPSSDGAIYVRVGWEFNGSWMPWAAKGHEAAFIDAFQELVTTFRSVSDKFKFVWDTTNDGGNMDPVKAYPGDAYVDVVGTDVYYDPQWDGTDAAKGFQGEVTRTYGLQWQQDFGASHGKATAISEWGVMTDNSAAYIKGITKWMSDHNMVYENYWNSNADYPGMLSGGVNPNAGAAYKSAIADLQASNTVMAVQASNAVILQASNAVMVTSGPANDTLVLRVSGDSYQGDPHFVVTVDGQQVGGTLTTSASHALGQTQDITLTGAFGPGSHDVAVRFLDDAWGGSVTADRNLYVHQISLDGDVQAGSTAANTGGTNTGGVAKLFTPGSATFHVGVPENDTLGFGSLTHDAYSSGGQVYALYNGLLGRAPDSLGL